jgi:hypothetical protein
MIEDTTKTPEAFQVFCTWCGDRIRANEDEDSFETCLRCFYRMISEQLASQRSTNAGKQFASDR